MEIQPDFNRFLKTVHHEEPDRTPLCEAVIGYSIMSRFLGREVKPGDWAGVVEFYHRAGYDFVPVPVSLMSPGQVTNESKITRLLKEKVLAENPEETDPKKWNLEITSFIHEREDFEAFPWTAAADIDFGPLEKVGKHLPEGMKIIAVSGKVFTLTWMLMGFQNFGLKLHMDKDLVRDVFRKVAEIQYSALERILANDKVGAVWVIDDVAFGSGPMLSPATLREHVFPWYRDMAVRCHDKDRVFMMHSDGDLTTLLSDIIDIGVDVLQPIDPTCMDIFKVKREWGDKLALAGNVSNEMLAEGNPDHIRDYVRRLLKDVAPGGGYLVGSGNSVPDWADFDNYLAMRDTVLAEGGYSRAS